MSSPQIVWLRRDLRMADQPALYAAAQAGPGRFGVGQLVGGELGWREYALVSEGSNPLRTVLMTTHSLERAIAVGQRMAILANGKVAYQESLEHAGTEAIRDAYMRHTGVAP